MVKAYNTRKTNRTGPFHQMFISRRRWYLSPCSVSACLPTAQPQKCGFAHPWRRQTTTRAYITWNKIWIRVKKPAPLAVHIWYMSMLIYTCLLAGSCWPIAICLWMKKPIPLVNTQNMDMTHHESPCKGCQSTPVWYVWYSPKNPWHTIPYFCWNFNSPMLLSKYIQH